MLCGPPHNRAIEHHFRELLAGNSRPDLDSLLAAYQQEWTDRDAGHIRFGKEETQASLDGLAQRMLRAFSASDLAVPQGRILAVEEELRGNLIPGLPDILARIDLIFETPHELVIADWKTSRSRWNAEQVEESAPQLLLYSDLVRELAPGKSLRVEFAVLTKTKERFRPSGMGSPWIRPKSPGRREPSSGSGGPSRRDTSIRRLRP
ncbi:MAG TPA: PD-(D/E)XK nuclease family protein [Pirellulaceae bacterium]|nr:PD-(D/E)XK nuclease family protein [Pirellulaceae bacterium]